MDRIIFDDSTREFILDTFGKTVDSHGFIVEKQNQHNRVLTRDGVEVKDRNFAGITKGSEIYYRSEITSLIDMYDDLARRQSHEQDGLPR